MVDRWDPASRQIVVGSQVFTASAEVPVIGLAQLRHVLMSGDAAAAGSPRVVTRIIVRRSVA
jgi:hypothetical protein